MKSMKAGFAVALTVSAALAFAQAPATKPAAQPAPAQPPASTAPAVLDAAGTANVSTFTAKIIHVNQKKRTVTLVGPMGKIVTLSVGPDVKNLAQVKKGDNLVIKYLEAVSVSLDTNVVGRSKTVTTSAPVTAPAGDKPGVAQAQKTVIVASVDRVDAATSHILVHGPQGRYVEVKVNDPAVMKNIKVGDAIVLTYTEAVVVDVQPAS